MIREPEDLPDAVRGIGAWKVRYPPKDQVTRVQSLGRFALRIFFWLEHHEISSAQRVTPLHNHSGRPQLAEWSYDLIRASAQHCTVLDFFTNFFSARRRFSFWHTAHTMEVFDEERHDSVYHTRKRRCPSAIGGGTDPDSPVFGSHRGLRGNHRGGCRARMVEPAHQRNATGCVYDGSLQCRPRQVRIARIPSAAMRMIARFALKRRQHRAAHWKECGPGPHDGVYGPRR